MVIIYKCSVSTFSFSIFDPRLTSDTALLVQLSTTDCSIHSMAHTTSTLSQLRLKYMNLKGSLGSQINPRLLFCS